MVVSGRPLTPSDLPYVDTDNAGGAELAVRHLLSLGRRRIATIAGPQDMVAGIDRLAGYRRALNDSDLRSLITTGDFTRDSGLDAMRQLLRDDPEIDAVFAASDLMALGALQALRAAGRRVPEDVAVIGFDDAPAAACSEPPLSTVRQPIAAMGREPARMVLRLSAGEPVESPVVFPTELVLRDTA
ncbi:substrate-binding domain-containing protein [Actinocorallia longicatena]|uniref:Transcriptional regulator LacI/GalR-like sensor domain-containing protein n=1 Tax=Actinocorallia longicatena TaxID=111803 RepID=A0ABP6Q195_9ACTN